MIESGSNTTQNVPAGASVFSAPLQTGIPGLTLYRNNQVRTNLRSTFLIANYLFAGCLFLNRKHLCRK